MGIVWGWVGKCVSWENWELVRYCIKEKIE